MHKPQKQVEEFMRVAGQRVRFIPLEGMLDPDESKLRAHLLAGEYAELIYELRNGDAASIAHEAIDVLYVTYGILATLGIDAEPLFDAVHEANMLKLGGPKDEFGKLLKPEGWVPATEKVRTLIKEQRGAEQWTNDVLTSKE